MVETTETKFRQKLEEIINDLCNQSKKLYCDSNKIDMVFSYYSEYRKKIHNSMDLSKHIHLDKKDPRMDRHKIAAAFLCSILKAKPIGYNKVGELPTFLENTANEQLGLIFGLFIIDCFNSAKMEKTPLEEEIYGLSIKLPECRSNNDEEYTTHFTKLILDKKVKNILDFEDSEFNITLIFFLSNIFFLIDSYSYYRNYSILDVNARLTNN
jgi:hypothetical protein